MQTCGDILGHASVSLAVADSSVQTVEVAAWSHVCDSQHCTSLGVSDEDTFRSPPPAPRLHPMLDPIGSDVMPSLELPELAFPFDDQLGIDETSTNEPMLSDACQEAININRFCEQTGDSWGCSALSVYPKNLLLAHHGLSIRIERGPPGLPSPASPIHAARLPSTSKYSELPSLFISSPPGLPQPTSPSVAARLSNASRHTKKSASSLNSRRRKRNKEHRP